MKETALHNGIELTEELYHAFMQEKAIRLQDSIEKRVDKINQKILELQQRSSDRGTTTIPSFLGHRVTSP